MLVRGLIVLASLALASCGSSTANTPTSPSGSAGTPPTTSPPPGNTPPAGPPVITITPTGLSPLEVTIAVGGTVTFLNSDRFGHEIWGGLDHNSRDCPEVEEAGFLTPNQRRDTAVFTTPKVCRFHDHTNIGNPAYQGRIIVQ